MIDSIWRVRRFRNWTHWLCLVAASLLLGFNSSPILRFQNKSDATHSRVRENGYFRADLGLFFVEDGRLDVYDGILDSGVIWDNVSGRLVRLREAEKQLPYHGEPYYHELFQLKQGAWTRISRDFATTPQRFLDFGPCDARDQLDLPDDDLAGLNANMRKVIPRGVRIKGVADLAGHLTALVISEMPKELPSIYKPGTYRLRLLRMRRNEQSWDIATNVDVEESAYYCGMRTLRTTTEDGEPALVLLVYSSVPQGSRILSVMRQIRSFIVPFGPSSN